ncbi:hypothetical protein HRbin08_02075 [bacterium HR08]|nr:hypothetical protein HRbin08_02075 [bacterium HR08]
MRAIFTSTLIGSGRIPVALTSPYCVATSSMRTSPVSMTRLSESQTKGYRKTSRASTTRNPPLARRIEPALTLVKSVTSAPSRTSRSMVPNMFVYVGFGSKTIGAPCVAELSTSTLT